MIAQPALITLRGDDTQQRSAQQALHLAFAQWRAGPAWAKLIAEIGQYARSGELAGCKALESLFGDDGTSAKELSCDFVAMVAEAITGSPLGHVPLRHFSDGITSTLQLVRTGNCVLSLCAVTGEGRPEPETVSFGPNRVHTRILAGRAQADLVECNPADELGVRLKFRGIALAPGVSLDLAGETQALVIRRIDGCLLSLKLQRRDDNALLFREYDLLTGRLAHQSAGNPRDSRIEMMLALLGRMNRADAAPLRAGIALEQGASSLRWQALRECLALDTLEGFRALNAIADAPNDPLEGPALSLRAQLLEQHPQLREIAKCPA